MDTIVVYDIQTKEIVACIPLENGKDYIIRDDVDFRIFNEVEPVFEEKNESIYLKDNAYVVDLRGDKE